MTSASGHRGSEAWRRRVITPDQGGETLIEILITIAIIGIAAAALLGALVTSVAGSGEHRVLAQEETALKSYADLAKQQIELQTKPDPLYRTCAVPSDYAVITTPSLPPALMVVITGISYWSHATHGFVSTCPDPPAPADDLQLVTLTASTSGGSSQTLSFVVRNPTYVP